MASTPRITQPKYAGRCEPGSPEQQLDMCETGELRGDEILHESRAQPGMRIDMSEENREGDEMSGDEHSSGLQGGEPELESQPHIDSGIPGDETRLEEEDGQRIARRRAS